MARPEITDRADGPHALRAAANVFNKQSRRTYKGWSPSFEGWATKTSVLLNVTQHLLAGCCEHINKFLSSIKGEKFLVQLRNY
jgi:hypothetical protein